MRQVKVKQSIQIGDLRLNGFHKIFDTVKTSY